MTDMMAEERAQELFDRMRILGTATTSKDRIDTVTKVIREAENAAYDRAEGVASKVGVDRLREANKDLAAIRGNPDATGDNSHGVFAKAAADEIAGKIRALKHKDSEDD